MVNVLRQVSFGRSMLVVVTDSSTPLFCTEPTFCSCWLKPVVIGTLTRSKRSRVLEWYASIVNATRLWRSAASSPALNWVCSSQWRSGLGMRLPGAIAGISVVPEEYQATSSCESDW